jgi:hypothetical protein
MARYHFDISRDGADWSDDDEGTDIPATELARDAAVELALEMAKVPQRPSEIAVRVRDGEPEPVLIVRVSVEVQTRD